MTDPLLDRPLTVVDFYTKSGHHLRTTISTESGTLISEEGPNPNKDVQFLYHEVWRNDARFSNDRQPDAQPDSYLLRQEEAEETTEEAEEMKLDAAEWVAFVLFLVFSVGSIAWGAIREARKKSD